MSKSKLIMVKIKDPNGDYFTHMTPDQIAESPDNLDLELLGLELVNRLRNVRGLTPVSYPKPIIRENFLVGGPKKIDDLKGQVFSPNQEIVATRVVNQCIVGKTMCGGGNVIFDSNNFYDKTSGAFTLVREANSMEIVFNANVKTLSPEISMDYEINKSGVVYNIERFLKQDGQRMIDSIKVQKQTIWPVSLWAGNRIVLKISTTPEHPITIAESDLTIRFTKW